MRVNCFRFYRFCIHVRAYNYYVYLFYSMYDLYVRHEAHDDDIEGLKKCREENRAKTNKKETI